MIDPNTHTQGPILGLLERAGADASKPSSLCCPFCGERKASSGLYNAPDGHVRFRCHSGKTCLTEKRAMDYYDLKAMIEHKELAEVLKEESGSTPKPAPAPILAAAPKPEKYYPTLEAIRKSQGRGFDRAVSYPYRDINGKATHAEIRLEGTKDGKPCKSYRYAHLNGNGWLVKKGPGLHPIYNLDRITKEPLAPVVVAEGARCVAILQKIGGIVATTAPGGCNTAPDSVDWSPLQDRNVTIWPDNDEGGREYAEKLAQHLQPIASFVAIVDIDAIGYSLGDPSTKGFDAVDFFGALETKEHQDALATVLASTIYQDALGSLDQYVEEIKSGLLRSEPWPFPKLHEAANPSIAKTITLVCGGPGSGKSFLIIQLLEHMRKRGDLRPRCYMLEEEAHYHLLRALAQRRCDSEIANPNWQLNNPEDLRHFITQDREWLDSLANCIKTSNDKVVTHAQMLAWVEKEAALGTKWFVIDPVTAIEYKCDVWTEDLRFLMGLRALMCKYGFQIILVTHPKKDGAKASLGNFAGGAAMTRFSQCCLFITTYRPPANVELYVRHDPELGAVTKVEETSHEIVNCKSRNGRVVGARLAFNFDSESLTFDELGTVAPRSA